MKVYLRKGSFLLTMFLALIMILSCFGLSACNPELPEIPVSSGKLTNESGFVVEGGDFGEGAALSASVIDGESEDYAQVITAIEGQNYDKTQPVYVFEVSVVKDGVKVQPNGKVKVTIPVSGDLTDYEVLHVKSDGTIERLSITYENGTASFETGSFSKFVFVKKAAPIIDDNSGNQGDNDNKGDDNTPAATCTFSASVEEYTGVDNIGKITENGNEVDFGEGREVAKGSEITLTAEAKSGYALKGWYKVDGTSKTLLSCAKTYTFTVEENMDIKAIFDVKYMVYLGCMGFDFESFLIKTKGVEVEDSSLEVAKGTEVTIKFTPCSGFVFDHWGRQLVDAPASGDWTEVSKNNEYTFIVDESYRFFASTLGIPKKLSFSYETAQRLFLNDKYKNVNGVIETTIKVGSTLTDYKDNNVQLYVYYANKAETIQICEFEIDDSAFNPNKAGRYEIIYTYKGYSPNGPVTMSIFINVVAE